jgi:hypothetical protein
MVFEFEENSRSVNAFPYHDSPLTEFIPIRQYFEGSFRFGFGHRAPS